MHEHRTGFIRQEEMAALMDTVSDRRTRAFAESLLATLWHHSSAGRLPVGDFDLEYFMQIAIAFGQKQELIAGILADPDHGRWPD